MILVTPRLVKPMARNTDLTPLLPGTAEQRDGPVWRSMLLGGAARTDARTPGTTSPRFTPKPWRSERSRIFCKASSRPVPRRPISCATLSSSTARSSAAGRVCRMATPPTEVNSGRRVPG